MFVRPLGLSSMRAGTPDTCTCVDIF